ncbi:MAG TPA: glycerate kinase [Saprospiraceae bacterium]|nr:glycerate kinase [Saprospiraceae bacterium]
MKILIAADSFKDALPAVEVCQAMARGAAQAGAHIETNCFPLGDGGEGTSTILTFHSQGQWVACSVHDPLLRPVEAGYGISGDGQTAFIEMAQAAGLQLLQPEERNPLKTSTFGVGEMIRDALRRGVTHIVLCIGGSATNDAGTGMAEALGYTFFDAEHQPLQGIGSHLDKIHYLTAPPRAALPARVTVLCDVDNPLYGTQGAAQVYARQKGADEAAVAELDAGLQHFAYVLQAHFGQDFATVPGAGAAGGLGAGAMAFLNARLQPGIETVMELTNFRAALRNVVLILTGEGKIDRQTLHGKLISGVVKHAGNIPVIALCGTLQATPVDIKQLGLQAAFSILNRPMLLPEALSETATLLEQTAQQVVQTWLPASIS